MIDLTVKTLDSQNHAFSLNDDITVEQFKEHIAETINIPVNTQRLIYCGRVLQDDKLLSEYDVNGKVIHLVQRAPPSVSRRGNSNTSQNQGQNQNSSTGDWHQMPRIHYRHTQFHGNPMYIGSVSIPADVLEGIASVLPQEDSVANRHLAVVRRMLDQANSIIDRLDNPAQATETTPENQTTSQSEQTQSQTSESDPEGASQSEFPMGVNFSLARVNRDGTFEPIIMSMNGSQSNQFDQQQQQQQQTEQQQQQSEEQPQSQPEQNQQETPEQPSASSNEGQTPPDEHEDSLLPRELAELMEKLLTTQERLSPYIRNRLLMNRDSTGATPSTSSADENQRVLDSVIECFHFLSHAQHALSNLSVNMQMAAPRSIRTLSCRPMPAMQPGIQSAILQAGLPIQVEAHISLHGQNDNNTNNNGNNNERNNTASNESPTSTSVDANSADASTNSTSTPTTQTTATAAATGNVDDQQQNNSNDSQQQQQQQQSQNNNPFGTIFNISNNEVEVVMEMPTITQSVPLFDILHGHNSQPNIINNNSNSNNNSSSNNNNNNNNNNGNNESNNSSSPSGASLQGGTFSWGTTPPPDIIRNVMQAVAGYMAQTGIGGATTIPITTTPPTTSSGGGVGAGGNGGSTRRRTVAVAVGESPIISGQNSQTRGNTETHPTTSTQTRTTSRTHFIHQNTAQALGLGVGFGLAHNLDFDPFLPCGSMHIRRGQGNNTAQTSTAASTQTIGNNSNRSTGTQVTSRSATSASTDAATSATAAAAATAAIAASRLRFYSRNRPPPNRVRSIVPLHDCIPTAVRQSTDQRPITLSNIFSERGISLPSNSSTFFRASSRSLIYDIIEIILSIPLHVLMKILNRDPAAVRSTLLQLQFCVCRHYRMRSVRPPLHIVIAEDIWSELRDIFQSVFTIYDRVPRIDGMNLLGITADKIKKHIRIIAKYILKLDKHVEGIEVDGENIFTLVDNFVNELFTFLRYALRDNLPSAIQKFGTEVSFGMSPPFRRWLHMISLQWFHRYLRQAEPIPSMQLMLMRLLSDVDFEGGSSESTEQQSTAAAAEPMEIDSSMNDQPPNDPLLDGEEIPTSFPGHTELLPDWVPIIARDGVRQRRQLQLGLADNNVTTLSDAYLSTMPSKRRKLVEQQKPSLLGTSTQNHSVITASMERLVRESIGHAGVEEVDGSIAALVAEPTVRRAFGQAIRESLSPRRLDSLDFPDPRRFPNATKFFADSNGSSK